MSTTGCDAPASLTLRYRCRSSPEIQARINIKAAMPTLFLVSITLIQLPSPDRVREGKLMIA
ncbi:MAG: hypothetical protein ACYTXA_15395 [Nostoc sp.]